MELSEQEREWKAHLDAAEAAGQTLANYARVHELDVSKLYGYRGKIKRKLKRATEPARRGKASFVRVEAKPQSSCSLVRIELPNGIGVVIEGSCDVPGLISSLASLS